MSKLQENIQKLIELMGFRDFSLTYDEDGGRLSIIVEDSEAVRKILPSFVSSLDHLTRLMIKKEKDGSAVFIDINNYRRERENIILELARGAARKALATKSEVSLPAMNSYERRLVHMELASRPDVKTESLGEDKNRYVVIKPIM